MKYDVTKGGCIRLGRCGENLAKTVKIDVSEYLKEYPGAVATLLHRRHGESGIYPVAAELRDGCLVWQVTSADTAIVGYGEAEVRVTVDGVLAKSKILFTVVDKSLTGQEIDAPEPGMDWVDKITNAIDSVKNMKAEAESVAYGEPAAAEYDGKTGTMHFGIPEGKPGRDGTDGKDGKDGAPGAKGDKGEPGSDANVTAANVEAALGYKPVKDVQVSGSSVLMDGVANVPMADVGVFGAIKFGAAQSTGFWVNDGVPYLSYATDAEISGRTGQRKTIVCTNLDYAVKAAMCDGKGAAWTSAEQAAARSRMGLDKSYELIEEIVLEENTSVIERDAEPNGNPYAFSKIKVLIIGMNSSGADAYYALTSNLLNKQTVSINSISGKNITYKSLFEIICDGALTTSYGNQQPGYNVSLNTLLRVSDMPVNTYFWPSGNIEGFIIRPNDVSSSAQLVAGTTIKIYGVRA